MEARKGAVAKQGLWETWPVKSRRMVYEPIPGLNSTLGALFRDNGQTEFYPDHCSHIGGLFPSGGGIFCIFCDSFPARHNPQFFERNEEE